MEGLLVWMHDHDRTIGYVASRSGIDGVRVLDLLAGDGASDDELSALSTLTGMPLQDLQPQGAGGDHFDPLRCYTVGEVAELMGVSADTVRAELRAGSLEHVVIGARVHRIPRWALEQRLGQPEGGRSPDSNG